AVRLDLAASAAMRENVTDLADRHHAAALRLEAVEQCRRRRRHGEIAAAGGAAEGAGHADKGPRDDAPNAIGLDQLAGDAADRVEALEAECLLVPGDLEDAVGRGVGDRLPGGEMLGAELVDDRRARGVTVAEEARQLRPLHQPFRESRGKARHGAREIAPVESDGYAGHFPMSARRVLAAAGFRGVAPSADGRGRGEAGGPRAGALAGGGGEPKPRQIGQTQFATTGHAAAGAVRGDVTEGIGARIAIVDRIAAGADAERIEDQDKGSRHQSIPAYPTPVLCNPNAPRSSAAARARVAAITPGERNRRYRRAVLPMSLKSHR